MDTDPKVITPIRMLDLPSARDKPPLLQQWVEFFNQVMQTPMLLSAYRKVSFQASTKTELWEISLEMPGILGAVDEKAFQRLMADADWQVSRIRRTAENNSHVTIIGRRNDPLHFPAQEK